MTAIHVMADSETWGKKPGFDLRSIGGTLFNPITGTVGKECRACNGGRGPGNVNDGGDCSDCMNTRTDHAGEFYIATDNPALANPPPLRGGGHWLSYTIDDETWHGDGIGVLRKYALRRDPETVQWWTEQSAEAQAAFSNPVDLRLSLIYFADWLRGLVGDIYDSTDFKRRIPDDIALWSHGPAFDPPIIAAAYDACALPLPWHYRAPRDTRTAFDLADVGDHSTFMQQFNHGTAHNALDDAISQARCVNAAYARLRDATYEQCASICEGVTSWGLSPTKLEVAQSTQAFCAKAIRAQKSDSPQRAAHEAKEGK